MFTHPTLISNLLQPDDHLTPVLILHGERVCTPDREALHVARNTRPD